MQRFIPYYGAKWKLAELYGPPRFDHVIEPFAGSAGYSSFWEPKKVTLIDCDPIICGVWRFLRKVSAKELMRLPSNISDVAELSPRVCQEAKWLIGFWFNHGLAEPAPRRSNWARNPIQAAFFWSETIKVRLASQVDRIRHWKIIEGSWDDAPDVKAHWHVDPPYAGASGNSYRFHSIQYGSLAKWCKSRRGFVQVCENDGATWLPFEPFAVIDSHRAAGHSAEAVCEMEN
jgi:site-specific DNA-adenine methylase